MTETPEIRPDLPDISKAEMWGENILVSQWSTEQMTKGGLYLPESTSRPLGAGTVLKVGRDVPEKCRDIIGNVVLFGLSAVEPLAAPGLDKSTVYLNYGDIMLVYPKEP